MSKREITYCDRCGYEEKLRPCVHLCLETGETQTGVEGTENVEVGIDLCTKCAELAIKFLLRRAFPNRGLEPDLWRWVNEERK